MTKEIFPESGIPVRKTKDLLPQIFKTESNSKFLEGALDPLVQPGVLDKKVGYIGRRWGKTYKSDDIYLDSDETLRSRYQLEPGVILEDDIRVKNIYDYLDFKNQLKFFGNYQDRDDLITSQDHYTWDPPIDWDKLVNYREYFWVPEGPPVVKVLGQAQGIISSYRVTLGSQSSYIFSPDGLTNNPTLTLYRGQKYRFIVNVPAHNFAIRSNLDEGSLVYNPILEYKRGQIVLYDGLLYQATTNIPAAGLPGTPMDLSSGLWNRLDSVSEYRSALDYENGVTNNRSENATITFDVPLDAPDTLFYQSVTDPNRYGRFIISNVEENTKIEVEKEILGKATYVSSNDISFTNGLMVRFGGQVIPEKYAQGKWLVEGVGDKITLTEFESLTVSTLLTTNAPEILFDDAGFDSQPFDDASAFPASKDYITIAKSSVDANPWSRYNRWFHRSVLNYAHSINNSSFDGAEETRAKRPIIEFKSNLQLYNHGAVAKEQIDYLDDFTTDVFSSIEGKIGYNIDGEDVFDGARILFTADTDSLVRNKIYKCTFLIHNGRRQISLREVEDSSPVIGNGVLIKRGKNNKGLMYHYNGISWQKSQVKNSVNQAPLFDLYDEQGISFADSEKYPVSSFTGSRILGYRLGNGSVDKELGFRISYLNIDNVGDIQFDFDFETSQFTYQVDRVDYSAKTNTGYFKINPFSTFSNAWTLLDPSYSQPIIDSVVSDGTNEIVTDIIEWDSVNQENVKKILIQLNGIKNEYGYARIGNKFVFEKSFRRGDVVTFKIYTDLEPNSGYYEIPIGLEKNPLNSEINIFTLGQASDHVQSAIELTDEFVGVFPGVNNLRDLADYKGFAKRFIKHSGIAPLSVVLLCDKEVNIVKSIQHSKKAYTDFKNNFIKIAQQLFIEDIPANFVDAILAEISKTQTALNPFSDSDMLGNGAFTSIDYVVEDEGIKTFALSQKFDLSQLSTRAVYVYFNDQQLIYGKDYEFNSVFGFVNVKIDLQEGDQIQIREYVSTGNNFIPPTPTKLGLYKKYLPQKFVDDTYVEPRLVIQGHDGSITVAYGDYRDDLLLELELRIYNNIKQEYDEKLFDIDHVLGGYYTSDVYSKKDLDNIINREFLTWISGTNTDYVNNFYVDTENSFTYTYNRMTDSAGTVSLPGWWRGVYQWFYDTDRPHRCPWEMLGFSEQPEWWEDQYGAAPYTSGNLLLWEDLRDGIIRQGDRAGTYKRYQRSSLMAHIPVDGDGKLLSPLDSGLAGNFSLINNQGRFFIGDVSPAEYAWRSSSEWPFAIVLALSLLKPFEFLSGFFIKSTIDKNKLDQIIDRDTRVFKTQNDLSNTELDTKKISGLILYVINYLKSNSTSISLLKDKISSMDVRLTHRLSGFVDRNQQKFILDSKSPRAQSSSVFIPTENYQITFNISSPIASVTYSGVIIEKVDRGWKISGYDSLNPYFNYHQAVSSQADPVISVGGVSEQFLEWTADKFYANGAIVRYLRDYYRCIRSHTSTETFDTSTFKKLPSLPSVGAVEAFRRKTFNRLNVRVLIYGEILTSIQSVIDFFLGYEDYLRSNGMVFDGYDTETQTTKDWFTACKEFMFWTKHNWSLGSLISLSPAADSLQFGTSIGVVDNLLDGFYGYQVLKSDGLPLRPEFINVNRDFQNFTISTTNTNQGIYFFRGHLVLKEHMAVFDDRTVFNDVIYDKATGYRQERIKSRGFRTVDWDGDYTSPGFLFDNVNIAVWQPFTDYRLGDIVSYKSFFWTSQSNQLGTDEFDETRWSKLDVIPEQGLVANFDFRINQFEDYYAVDSDGVGSSQRDLARHLIGYQQREYLQQLSEDQVSQFKLYQGFIKEKGTANAVIKVFDKLSRVEDDAVQLNEEWAFRLGEYGGVDQSRILEFDLDKDKFKINPQPVQIVVNASSGPVIDQIYRISASDFIEASTPFTTEINPVIEYRKDIRSAGYVNYNDVQFTLKNRQDLLGIDIGSVNENDHFWITFDLNSWTVIRYNEPSALRIIAVADAENKTKTARLFLNVIHNISAGDYVGIKGVANLQGFFIIDSVTNTTIDVKYSAEKPSLEDSAIATVGIFSKSRISNYETIDPPVIALLPNKTKLWIDDNGSGKWSVIEKIKQYSSTELINYGITDPRGLGSSLAYIETRRQIVTNLLDSDYVMVYTDNPSSLRVKQIISPPSGYETALTGTFGKKVAVSPDDRWLIVGSPNASGVLSNYLGDLTPSVSYLEGEIVLWKGRTWRARDNVFSGDGSSIDFNNQNWEPANLLFGNVSGRGTGYFQQGMISVYQYADDKWENSINIISPFPAAGELFGSEISISVSNGKYYMAVSAIGADNGKGRLYLFEYVSGTWRHLQNEKYAGVWSSVPGTPYPLDTIVWDEGNLYQSILNSNTSGSVRPSNTNNGSWLRLDPIATQVSLPTSPSIADDDGSTLATGLLTDEQIAEAVKAGDQFGYETAMNRDGSILAVGVPNSDGQFFANFKGTWKSFDEYRAGDVVKHMGNYYRLVQDDSVLDSAAYSSKNNDPEFGSPWLDISDASSSESTGKVYIYKRINDNYQLKQIITAENLSAINDTGDAAIIEIGDQFGFSVDVDTYGLTIAVSAPLYNINKQTQGAVFVFKTDDLDEIEYRLKEKLQSYEDYNNEYFGSSIKFSPSVDKLVVGARNSAYRLPTGFELATTFDKGKTRFSDSRGFPGQVYVFENKTKFLLTEKLEANFATNESFGSAVDCTDSVILVGSPNYTVDEERTGKLRVFRKNPGSSSLNIIRTEQPLIDLDLLKNIEIYNRDENLKLGDIDIVDSYKLKILGVAEQELSFKTVYDPAIYTVGTDEVVVDETIAWFDKNVGKLWWDLSTAKFVNYEQSDFSYRVGYWNNQAVGSTIDVYEWVESVLLPSEWSILADTVEGLAQGISGQPKFVDGFGYSVRQQFNPTTGQEIGTKYYYWVKNKTTLPSFETRRRISAAAVAELINNPIGSNLPFVSIIDKDKLLFHNIQQILPSDRSSMNVEYVTSSSKLNQSHREYLLLTEGVAESIPEEYLERKWIDSLVGFDESGNPVPDSRLPNKRKYGVSFRPRQSMFIDRIKALKILIDRINIILATRPFSDTLNFRSLNSIDPLPSPLLNQYDIAVEDFIDLEQVGTVRIRPAILSPNIINGKIDTIDIIDSGLGYRTPPFLDIEGTGVGASADITIDNQGRVDSVTITNRGRKYTFANVKIRPFSVLVKSDSTAAGRWSIYAYDRQRKVFFRSKSQGFDTARYWEYIDYWAEGYGPSSRIIKEINSYFELETENLSSGDLIRIKEYANGGWAVFEKLPSNNSLDSGDDYRLVGREQGTIRIKDTIYDFSSSPMGFDAVGSYDSDLYDLQPAKELRIILQAIKNDILIEDLRVEYNRLFFSSIRYAFSEQPYIDWAFKTSFLNAIHNNGELIQKVSYVNDNLESFRDYIEEIKPFRTTIREYTSRYTKLESTDTAIVDFDLPPVYSTQEDKIIPINENVDAIDRYPWKWWLDNKGYSIVGIEVADPGAGYTNPPTVLITGDGSGATAKAFISNQQVSGIIVITSGKGYTKTPRITLVGGNGSNPNIARAVPILGSTVARTFDMTIKFDRISKDGLYQNFTQEVVFTATGLTATFDLEYPPTYNKNNIQITKNDEIVLSSDYVVDLYEIYIGTYTVTKGKIIFNRAPTAGDVIRIIYDKNPMIFDSVNRIDRFYSPMPGMKGKEKNQLMTGIDYGGVQIQGTTFDVTGGWDALPWYVDNWDSVESSADYYYIADGSTTYVVLPYAPAEGELITIYLKRDGEFRPTRIDDPYWNSYDGSTTQPNGRTLPAAQSLIPTFIGDGSTKIVDLYDQTTDMAYLNLNVGDTLIFRKIESDGSVVINDINLLDTRIGGGSFDANGSTGSQIAANTIDGSYTTATGLTPEEIVIRGDSFISPDEVPAPEENVPGQVLDSLSVKVFNLVKEGSVPLQNKVRISDGLRLRYSIGLNVAEEQSVIVYVNKIKKLIATDYIIDYLSNDIVFNFAPANGDIVEIISIGIGGVGIIDYQEFIADGDTNLFLTSAQYDQVSSLFVTVDGIETVTGFINSSEVSDTENKAMVQFGITPSSGSVIKIFVFAFYDQNIYGNIPIIRINQEAIFYDGTTASYELTNFQDLNRSSQQAAILVEINGQYLKGVDTEYLIYDGTNNQIQIGVDPAEAVGAVTSGQLSVYINNRRQRFVLDYVYNGNANLIIIPPANLQIGDVIKIENNLRAQYSITDNVLTIEASVVNSLENNDDSTLKDLINITYFSEYPSLDLIADEYTGGKLQYQLPRKPLAIEYVWVYKNKIRLIQDRDYRILLDKDIIYLNSSSTSSDEIKIVLFGSEIYKSPRAFEIFKDMLNNTHYKRYSKNSQVVLAKDLYYYDTSIEISDASYLADPIPSRKIPGVIVVNKERIEYFSKHGNILSQIRRGSLGTAVSEFSPSGSHVIDAGAFETLPYNETQQRYDFVILDPLIIQSDGTTRSFELDTSPNSETLIYAGLGNSANILVKVNGEIVSKNRYTVSVNNNVGTIVLDNNFVLSEIQEIEVIPLLVGPLDTIPRKSSRNQWYRQHIPEDYGPCDELEIFASGTRLRKNPLDQFEETMGIASPQADKKLEAEFSVDGLQPYVRLSDQLPAGTRIAMIKKQGRLWYERGETTASNGKSLLQNRTSVAQFILQKGSELPE